MEKAKQAAANFLSMDGKHKTSVDQDIRGAVTEEHVRPHRHETITTAVDKEVHQHHHQTRIQPVKVQETRPETSSHILNPVEHRTFRHGNEEDTRARLQQEAAAFKDSSVTHETTHSSSDAPVVSGEHVHHHVHEHIQPVIQKETITPHVVHRTAPIHETHHAAPIHHEVTTLPVKTLEEFRSGGMGVEGKSASTLREFDGCPGPYNKGRELPATALHPDSPTSDKRSSGVSGGENMTDGQSPDGNYTFSDKKGGGVSGAEAGAAAGGAAAGTAAAGTAAPSGMAAGSGMQQSSTGSSLDKATPRSEDAGGADAGGTKGTAGGRGRRRASLMDRVQDKLNPRVDSDGDGKKGFLH